MFFVISTKRSGHHAFIEWLYDGIPFPKAYFNNCGVKRGDSKIYYAKLKTGGLSFKEDFVVADEISNTNGNLIFSSENKTLDWYSSRFSGDSQFSFRGDMSEIVFLRDPFNAFCSLCKLVERKPEKIHQLDEFVASWTSLAKHFIGQGCALFSSENVFYNEFVRSDAYRQNIASKLGVKNSVLRSDLSTFGGGGNTMFGDPKEYSIDINKLERRWESLESSELLKNSITDEFLGVAKDFCTFVDRPELFEEPYRKFFP